MTIEINLTNEIGRINDRLKIETPGSDIYHRLMEDLHTAVMLLRTEQARARFAESGLYDDTPCDQPCPVGETGEPGILPDEPVEAAEEATPEQASAKPEETAAPDPAPAPAPEESKPDPATLPKKADVRMALGKARTERGVNVTAILQDMGVDNFNDLPADRYPELLEKLG